jgi:hypothetical protein
MKRLMRTVLGAAFLSLTLSAAAQKPAAYPSKGQSASQQSKDDGECLTWAQNSVASNPAAQPPQSGTGNERVQGAARGAVGGAAIGAIAGDAGTGAAVGAAAGTMAGGKRKRDNQAAQQQQGNAAYYNAYGACMKGRGYTVN